MGSPITGNGIQAYTSVNPEVEKPKSPESESEASSDGTNGVPGTKGASGSSSEGSSGHGFWGKQSSPVKVPETNNRLQRQSSSSAGDSWSTASSYSDGGCCAPSVHGQELQLLTLQQRKVGHNNVSSDADESGSQSDEYKDPYAERSGKIGGQRGRTYNRIDSSSSVSTIRPETPTPTVYQIIRQLREWASYGCSIEELSVGMSSTTKSETGKHYIPEPAHGETQVWLVKPPDELQYDSDLFVPAILGMPDEPIVVKVEVKVPGRRNRLEPVSSESTILRRLDHDHVVRYIGSGEQRVLITTSDSGKNTSVQLSYLQMEYVGDNLHNWLKNEALSPEALVSTLADISCQCFEALDYLQESEIVHCDIKPENLLVGKNASGKPMLKIADFGFAYDAASGFKVCRDGKGADIPGSEQFAAPETKPRPGAEQTLTYQSDIYSFGLTIASLLCDYGVIDSGYRRVKDGSDRKLTLDGPNVLWASNLVSLIEKTLRWNPEQRVTAGKAAEQARKLLSVNRQSQSTETEQ